MPIYRDNDDYFASVGIGAEGPSLYDRVTGFLPVKATRAFFGASQNIGGQLAGELVGDDLYRKAVARSLGARGVTGDSGDLETAEALPGAGDVLAEAVPEGVQTNPFYRAIWEPILRLGGNIVGDPTNLLGVGAIAKGFGAAGAAAFAPDVVRGTVEGVEAIQRGVAEGDWAGAAGGATQTTLSAGLGILAARGLVRPKAAHQAMLRNAAEKGDPQAAAALKAEAVAPSPEEPLDFAAVPEETGFVPEEPGIEVPEPPIPTRPQEFGGYPLGDETLDIPFPGPKTLTPARAEIEGIGARFESKRAAAEGLDAAAQARDAAIRAKQQAPKGEPQIPVGYIRLYRGQGMGPPPAGLPEWARGDNSSLGTWFSPNKQMALDYVRRQPELARRLLYVDVPEATYKVYTENSTALSLTPLEVLVSDKDVKRARPLLLKPEFVTDTAGIQAPAAQKKGYSRVPEPSALEKAAEAEAQALEAEEGIISTLEAPLEAAPVEVQPVEALLPPRPDELPPPPKGTTAPAVEAAISNITGDPMKEELAGKFSGLQQRVIAGMERRKGIDPVALDKAVGDAFLEELGRFVPSERAAADWAAGRKEPVYNEFRQKAQAHMRSRARDAFQKRAASLEPDVAPTEGGKAPSEKTAAPTPAVEAGPTLADQLATPDKTAADVESTVRRVVDPKKSVQENQAAVSQAMVAEHPEILAKLLKNPGKGGEVAGEGFKANAWKAWSLRQADPGLQNQEIAKLLGVNKTQVTKYLQAVGEVLGTGASKAKAVAKAGKDSEFKLQGKLSAGPEPTVLNWEGPGGKTQLIRAEDGALHFNVPEHGTLSPQAATDGITLILQYPDVYSGRIDLSALDKDSLALFKKAKFIEELSDGGWKVLPDRPTLLGGGLGFIPSPRLATLIDEIGDQGIAAVRKGAELLRQGVSDVGAWSVRMIREFGDGIKKFLRGIYNEASKAIRSFSFGELPAAEEAARQAGPSASMLGAGDFDKLLREAVPGRTKVEEEARALAGKTAQIGLETHPRATPPGSPTGEVSTGERLPPGVNKQAATNVAYNSQRTNLPRRADAIAVRVMEHLNPMLERAKGQTEKQWLKDASGLLGVVSPDTFINEMSKVPGMKPHEAIALRQLAKEAWTSVSEAKDKLLAAAVGGDTEKEFAAARNYLEAMRDATMAGAVAGNSGTRAGRLLRSYGTILNMDPKNYRTSRMLDALREIEGVNKEKAKFLFDLWQAGQYDAFARGINDASTLGRGLHEIALDIWRAGLLGPPGLIANALSNFGVYMARGRERTLAAGLDRLRVATFGGERALYRMPRDIGWMAYQDAASLFWPRLVEDLIATARARPLKVRGPQDVRRVAGSLGQTRIEEFLKSNYKLLEAGDGPALIAAAHRHIAQFAWTEAMNQGGGETAARTLFPKLYEELKQHVASRSFGDTAGGKATAWDAIKLDKRARRVVLLMNQDTYKEDLTGALRSFASGIRDSTLFSIIAPFVTTPINIARETARRTPLGLAMLIHKIHKTRVNLPMEELLGRNWLAQTKAAIAKLGPEEIEDDLSKMLAGTIGGYLVVNALGNHLTGGGPSDPKKQEQLKRTGWQPYSIKAGDQYISYQRLEPLSSIVGMATDIKEGLEYGEFDKLPAAAKRLVATLTDNMTNKTFLSGLEGLFTMWSDPKRYADRWIKQLQGSAVPNTIGYLPFGVLARGLDPTFRQTEAFTAEPFIAKIPGLSQTLEPQLGPTGEERGRGETFIERVASPFRRSTVKIDPEAQVASEADRVGYVMTAPRRYQAYGAHKVDYTKAELAGFVDAQQRSISRMHQLLKDPSYLRLPDNEEDPRWNYGTKTKQDVMRDVFSKFRKMTLQRIKPGVLARGRREYGSGRTNV